VAAARGEWLNDGFLATATEDDFLAILERFYESCVNPALHAEVLRRRSGIVRRALEHLLHNGDALPCKLERCLAPDGPYYVAGLGPSFWSALCQALDPMHHPSWTATTVAGLQRLGLLREQACRGPGAFYTSIWETHQQLFALAPALHAFHLEHFLTLLAGMRGRDLWSGHTILEADSIKTRLRLALGQERSRLPLRRRIKERGQALQEARQELEAGMARRDGQRLRRALLLVDAANAERAPIDWDGRGEELTLWIGRLWETHDAHAMLDRFWTADPIAGAGLWLPTAVLHLLDPHRFAVWDEAVRQDYALLDDSAEFGGSPSTRYRLFNEGTAWLQKHHHFHPLETHAVLTALGRQPTAESVFGGFCADTFRFLAELADNNRRDWMEGQRERYRFAVREPLIELCRALTERYVEPVLANTHGWRINTLPRPGHALTSICKNDYGRTQPYNTALWITFCRNYAGAKRADAQLFVHLDASGLSFGLRLGREAREAGHLLRRNLREQAGPVTDALRRCGALVGCRFGHSTHTPPTDVVTGPDDLLAWSAAKELVAGNFLPADAALLGREDLVGEIMLTFDRLLLLYACAVADDPTPWLSPRTDAGCHFTPADFQRATYLDDTWLGRARELLRLKQQLIMQGVPGTGKTHVARCLARLLTDGRDDAVRLVQFHPAYSYEEFVEGIKVKSVEVNGRCDVSYPVEDGLLCTFAAEASRQPALPYVLLIDEINRGNLPRIFGELLYLLEYRDQAVVLPYSRRAFRLPPNLYVIGTMNAADRSVARVDQALRRRFSFLEMPPDAGVLAAWLRDHPPAGRSPDEIVSLFERLNHLLQRDVGPQHGIGHSYFMVPELDETRLRVIWEHHIRPQLEEHFTGQPDHLAAYQLESLLDSKKRGRHTVSTA
jgi:hypothetical protein